MRRSIALLALTAALVSATSAAAALQPIRRQFGEQTFPRLRAGTIRIPAGQADGRVRVVVTLRQPPLAAAFGRDLFASGASRRLDARSASSRAYLARLVAAQRAAAAELRRAIPEARISRRFRIVLDGLTVSLPARRLPALVRQPFVAKVYPSARYTLLTDRSPSVIGADVLEGTTGLHGDGVKIGVVDDGVDQTNPYFDPAGYSYPSGFPLGDQRFTTPKVIVAKAFPGPGSGAAGALPLDRASSFHGTHVAGIAAGNAGTNAPAGQDHPAVQGLSGVAPRAWIGNYRVFTVPTPIGHVANTPEIIAAFEAAVADGMDVINFSGGGPQSEPVNDAMIEAVRNVAAAGVVPVIAAGNDRDDFGLGTTGSPGTAPDAISVAAVTNTHAFAPALTVTAAGASPALTRMPIQTGFATPPAWETVDQTLVDVGTIVGQSGAPVERHLCGAADAVNDPRSTDLAPGALQGTIALVSRGICSFISKAQRAQAAGAIGMVLVNNRHGEASGLPIQLPIPAGMISDLDGALLRDFVAQQGGRTQVRIGRSPLEIETGRSGVVTFFSSAGPTPFGHDLKPDVAAPGGMILSSTLPQFAGTPFAVFDGTSMATPHVTGAAALLVQRHPGWTPQQVKSALVSTAGPAWNDTARTQEAPVLLEGGGLVNLPRADDPQIFTDPVSISIDDINANHGAQSRAALVRVSDAGDGAGAWQPELQPQSASAGATIDLGPALVISPGGEADLPVVVRVAADAAAGDDYGFIVLRRGDDVRRIPYLFSVTRPALESVQPKQLVRFQVGSTLQGTSRVDLYRYPTEPFGPPPDYATGKPMDEKGAEQLYVTTVNDAVANLGVSVELSSPNALIHPWFLGSPDENDVQGYAGTPVNVNGLMFDFKADLGAAGTVFPRQQTFYVSVDSGQDPFTGAQHPGRYLLRSWVNDVTPPTVRLLTARVAAGRPTLAARVTDAGSGVDPLSLVIGYYRVLVGAAAYDPVSGIAVFPLPTAAPKLKVSRRTAGIIEASDNQEAKNVNTSGSNVMPNTSFKPIRLQIVAGPAVSWLAPGAGGCATSPARLLVLASSTAKISSVRFFDGRRRIATVKNGAVGLYAATWRTKGARKGTHRLLAVALDANGRKASTPRPVRVCK